MEKRMYAEYTKVERSIKRLDRESQISREIITRDLQEAFDSFKRGSVRAPIHEMERILEKMHRLELRDAQRIALQEVADSMLAGEPLIEGEEVDDQPALAYTAELVSNDEFEGIAVIHGDTAIVAFGEYEEATDRWEFRTDHRNREEVPFLSLYAGNDVASSEFARRVAEAVYAISDEIG